MSIQKLSSFISFERDRFDTRHNNMFTFAFSQVTRHYEFLRVIATRHNEMSKAFIGNFKEFQSSLDKTPGSHPMTQVQMKIEEDGREITTKLHLEIESYYLFSKILLDEMARAIEFYFGQARGLSLDSHDLLSKNLVNYAAYKKLALNDSLVTLAKKLKEEVSDFRDYQIAHHKNPRTARGTMFGPTGETRMSLNSVYPKPGDRQIESKSIQELMNSIDSYISQVVDFLKGNSKMTGLQLNT